MHRPQVERSRRPQNRRSSSRAGSQQDEKRGAPEKKPEKRRKQAENPAQHAIFPFSPPPFTRILCLIPYTIAQPPAFFNRFAPECEFFDRRRIIIHFFLNFPRPAATKFAYTLRNIPRRAQVDISRA